MKEQKCFTRGAPCLFSFARLVIIRLFFFRYIAPELFSLLSFCHYYIFILSRIPTYLHLVLFLLFFSPNIISFSIFSSVSFLSSIIFSFPFVFLFTSVLPYYSIFSFLSISVSSFSSVSPIHPFLSNFLASLHVLLPIKFSSPKLSLHQET